MGTETRASKVATKRVLITANFHGHECPKYGLITSEEDGEATVEFVDEKGETVIVLLPMDVLEFGDRVDKSYLCGEAYELRFRFYLAPFLNSQPEEDKEDGEQDNVWCQGQVESIVTIEDVLHVKFRGRGVSKSLIVPVELFKS